MGLLRILLAIAVVKAHTGGFFLAGGREAVLLFYIISGFYMAMILSERYVGEGALKRFYLSRYLRLWVPYLCALALALFVYAQIGVLGTFWDQVWRAPDGLNILALISNFTLFGLDLFPLLGFDQAGVHYLPYEAAGHNGARLMANIPLFSVAIEMWFYLVAPFFVKDARKAFAVLLCGGAWLAASRFYAHDDLGLLYHMAPAGIGYFALGAIMYHVMKNPRNVWLYTMAGAGIVIMFYSGTIATHWTMPAVAMAVPVLFKLTRNIRTDNIIGEFSYLIYILHLPFMMYWRTIGVQNGETLFLYVLTSSMVMGIAVYLLVERPLNRFRRKHFGSGLGYDAKA